MSGLTRYGTIWGQIPQTSGQVFWVAPAASYTVNGKAYSASDNNDGLWPNRALLTLDYAVGLCTANAGDVIVLLPGAHSWSASVAVDVAGITMTGLPGGKGNPIYKRTTVTTSAADEVMNVTAADVEIAHLQVIAVTQKAGIDYTAAADRLYVHDCVFDLYTATAHTSTKGVASTTAIINTDSLVFENNVFISDGAQGPGIDVGDSNGYLGRNNLFLCTAGTWAAAVQCSGVTNQTGVWDGNKMVPMAGAAITKGFIGSNLTSASSVHFYGNFFGDDVTVGIDDFSSGDAVIAENYVASIGGGSGGTLITAIT